MSDTNKVIALSFVLAIAVFPTLAQERSAVLEEVIVTAQKRSESQQDAPISLIAMTSDDLEAKGISNLQDLRASVPNLQITPFPTAASTPRIFIRGIGNTDNQFTQDPSVAVYLNGVYMARSEGLSAEIADIERIEVLRGPQGTLYGRNATGGAINFITVAPNPEALTFKQKLSVGQRKLFSSRTSLNVPLSDNAAILAAYMNIQQDGFIENAGQGEDTFGSIDRNAALLDVLWDITDRFAMRYSYDRSVIEDSPAFIDSVATGTDTAEDRPRRGSRFVAALPNNEIQTSGHSLTLTWDVTDALTLKSISSYRDLDAFSYQDFHSGESSEQAMLISTDTSRQHQLSQELQALGSVLESQLQYTLGVFYFSEEGVSSGAVRLPDFPIDLTGDGRNDVTADVADFNDAEIENKAWSAYGEVSYRPAVLNHRLAATIGLRYSVDSRLGELLNNRTELNNISPATPFAPLPFPGGANLVFTEPDGYGDRDFRDFSPSFVVAYETGEASNVYGKVARGYKSGGFNARASSVELFNEGFEKETLISYELGIKSQWWNDRLRVNAAVFKMDFDDIQVNVSTDPDDPSVTDVFNAGEATIDGAELDISLVPFAGMTLDLRYGYLDAEYDVVIDSSGQNVAAQYRFINAPAHSAAVDVAYQFPQLSFGVPVVTVGYSWQDVKTTDFTPFMGDFLGVSAYGLLNARLALTDVFAAGGQLDFALWGKNLTDEEYLLDRFPALLPSAFWGAPRSAGLDIIYRY